MKRSDDPNIVSLESHRRRRLEESRKTRKARPAAIGEKAINWRKVPLLLAVIAAFVVVSWLIGKLGSMLPFH